MMTMQVKTEGTTTYISISNHMIAPAISLKKQPINFQPVFRKGCARLLTNLAFTVEPREKYICTLVLQLLYNSYNEVSEWGPSIL